MRRDVSRTLIMLAMGLIVGFGLGELYYWICPLNEGPPDGRIQYIVRNGDTLWSIAEKVFPNEDPRTVINWIKDLNDLDNNEFIHRGDRLIIPTE